jgi:hypothetical protein
MRQLKENGNITVVPVYCGGTIVDAIIDTIDAPKVSKYLWSMNNGYARTGNRNAPFNGYLHRLILAPKLNEQVDHIDGNRLNNIRDNLRLVTNQQNQMARHVAVSGVGYKGVHKHGKGFRAHIKFNGKQIRLGSYPTAIKAAKAYNQAAIALFGEYAVINEVSHDVK